MPDPIRILECYPLLDAHGATEQVYCAWWDERLLWPVQQRYARVEDDHLLHEDILDIPWPVICAMDDAIVLPVEAPI